MSLPSAAQSAAKHQRVLCAAASVASAQYPVRLKIQQKFPKVYTSIPTRVFFSPKSLHIPRNKIIGGNKDFPKESGISQAISLFYFYIIPYLMLFCESKATFSIFLKKVQKSLYLEQKGWLLLPSHRRAVKSRGLLSPFLFFGHTRKQFMTVVPASQIVRRSRCGRGGGETKRAKAYRKS